ncbi:MAG: endolytic transglycosylase MltG [Candidatus Nomurabacteria bacterium]|jgi:UPF0755 protein|nr:endolytic transglycosylase MltG [Candidatus Nomurabacteria bacterium]
MQRNKQNFWQKLSPRKQVLLVIVGALLILASFFTVWLVPNLQPLDSENQNSVKVEIRSGASIEEVAVVLGDKQLIRSNLAYIMYSRLTFARIEAGMHEISPSMSLPEIASILGAAKKDSFSITITPEANILELKELFKKYDFTEAEIEAAFAEKYVHALLLDKPAGIDLEGYIFPDTYEMHTADSLESLFERSFDNLYNKLQADGSLGLARSKGLSIFELLTLASIVGKEAPGVTDQKIIAGVFWNRLDKKMPLGSDVTFKYAYKMGYCKEDSPSCQSAWNTRIHTGLPPGPIANMNYETIQAVLKPTESDYLYFVAGDDGKIYYASTDEGHQQNVANYCTKLCQ